MTAFFKNTRSNFRCYKPQIVDRLNSQHRVFLTFKIQKENIQHVIFRGDRRALHDLQILANVNYGEDLMGKGVALPKELGYLK